MLQTYKALGFLTWSERFRKSLKISYKYSSHFSWVNEDLAELYGVLLGDGCLSLVGGKRKRVLISGNLKNDLEYYKEVIRPMILRFFHVRGYLQRKPKRGSIYFWFGSSVFDFASNMGFPIGRKTELLIPPSIFSNKQFFWACIRGIFNTDGCVYARYSKPYGRQKKQYFYSVIQFRMKQPKLLLQMRTFLEGEGVDCNKLTFDGACHVLRITRQESVALFMEKINTKHKYHLERYLNTSSALSSTGP